MLAKILASRLVLRPSKNRLEHVGLTRVTFPYSRGEIEAFVSQRRMAADGWLEGPWDAELDYKPQVLVLKLPGIRGRGERSTLFPANLLDGVSSEVWTWNPPGYGRSSGRATLAAIAAAAIEFFDQVLAERCGQQTFVLVHGNSLGCATSLYLSTQLRTDGLLLRNPPPLVDLVHSRNAWWNLRLASLALVSGIPPEMDAVAVASQVTKPIVFIESGADMLVPPAMQALIRDAHPGQQHRIVLAGAGHDAPIDDRYHQPISEAMQWLIANGRPAKNDC